ncbi:hypothetical protein ACFWY5_12205 [Nonomuraea sp. NPDC059007]|uniref:hypothetical protein n=1 Tax=Nonomuraea sp. NPDC059007 TaxID=3346692 RepID=UPI00368C1E3E
MTKHDGLSQFAAGHAEWFARSAYLLTGDPERARDLAIQALVKTGRRWSVHRWNRPVEAVLSTLYRAYLVDPAEPPASFPLAGMSPLGRVAVVAQFHDGLDPHRAAQLVGTWMPGALQEETERVRATHPHLLDLGGEAATELRPHEAIEAPGDSPWAAPWQADDLAAPPSPWPAPPSPAPLAPSPALVRLAAELPVAVPMNIAQTAPRLVLRRRLVMRSVFTTLSFAGAGAFVALTIVVLSALANSAERAAQRADAPISEPDLTPTELDPTPTAEEPQPDPLPERLDEPISRAYQGFCNSDAPYDTRRPPECAQWRLVGKSGTEWRLDASQAAKQTTTVPDVAVSQDGRRVAYLDTWNDYVVRDLATGKHKTFAIQLHGSDPEFVSSRNGRYFAVNFLQSGADSPMLDFTKGRTTYGAWTMAITDDGKRVIDESMASEASSDTKIKLAGRRFRVDAEVGISGAALSPDGRTLAVADDDKHVITLDTRTGHVTKLRRLADEEGAQEIDTVERWLNANEVMVRLSDVDDEVYLAAVDVRTGKTRDLDAGDLEYGDVLGAFTESSRGRG